MTTTSKESDMDQLRWRSHRHPVPAKPLSYPEQHPARILEAFFDRHEELHRFAAVDDPVIVGHREVHHRPDHNLAVHHHGPLLGLVHAQDGALRSIYDRGRHQRAEHAAVGDGERAARQIFDRDRALARLLRVLADFFLDVAKLFTSASRTIGTIRPRSVETATPMS